MKKEIVLCAISNVASGNCAEDCGFCAQSARHKADIESYKLKDIKEVLFEAKRAKEVGAYGFCLVTSGKRCDDKKLEHICKIAFEIEKEIKGLHLIACLGLIELDELKELKKHGIKSYNHNLESSRSFYKKVCTTIDWDERFATALSVKEAGLLLCCGGIFGLGESWEDRFEFLDALESLSPHSVPINFFHPNKALSIKMEVMQKKEAIECIKIARAKLKNSMLMVAGGREIVFGSDQKELFDAGVDAVVIGNYLTTKGEEPNSDIERILSYGYKIATNPSC